MSRIYSVVAQIAQRVSYRIAAIFAQEQSWFTMQ
jgi:hypothetical protein